MDDDRLNDDDNGSDNESLQSCATIQSSASTDVRKSGRSRNPKVSSFTPKKGAAFLSDQSLEGPTSSQKRGMKRIRKTSATVACVQQDNSQLHVANSKPKPDFDEHRKQKHNEIDRTRRKRVKQYFDKLREMTLDEESLQSLQQLKTDDGDDNDDGKKKKTPSKAKKTVAAVDINEVKLNTADILHLSISKLKNNLQRISALRARADRDKVGGSNKMNVSSSSNNSSSSKAQQINNDEKEGDESEENDDDDDGNSVGSALHALAAVSVNRAPALQRTESGGSGVPTSMDNEEEWVMIAATKSPVTENYFSTNSEHGNNRHGNDDDDEEEIFMTENRLRLRSFGTEYKTSSKLQEAFQAQAAPLCLLTGSGKILDCTNALTKILGFNSKELIGLSLDDLSTSMNTVYEDDSTLSAAMKRSQSNENMYNDDGDDMIVGSQERHAQLRWLLSQPQPPPQASKPSQVATPFVKSQLLSTSATASAIKIADKSGKKDSRQTVNANIISLTDNNPLGDLQSQKSITFVQKLTRKDKTKIKCRITYWCVYPGDPHLKKKGIQRKTSDASSSMAASYSKPYSAMNIQRKPSDGSNNPMNYNQPSSLPNHFGMRSGLKLSPQNSSWVPSIPLRANLSLAFNSSRNGQNNVFSPLLNSSTNVLIPTMSPTSMLIAGTGSLLITGTSVGSLNDDEWSLKGSPSATPPVNPPSVFHAPSNQPQLPHMMGPPDNSNMPMSRIAIPANNTNANAINFGGMVGSPSFGKSLFPLDDETLLSNLRSRSGAMPEYGDATLDDVGNLEHSKNQKEQGKPILIALVQRC